MTSDDFRTKITKVKTALEAIFVKKADRSHISYGQVDSTSTSTAFTATVTGLTSLTDGATVMLRNGYITSAEGFTLNVNGLGAKPVYNSMADATRDTTIFNINYTMLFVYDSTRIENGCWICYRGYNSDKDTNTIGYQIRTNSSTYTATDKFIRYRLLLEVDNGHYMPVNTSTSTSGTASKSSAMNTREFKIGGRIMYYGTTAAVSANTQIAGITYLWTQINLVLGYSFSNSSSGPSLTTGEPVYMIAKPSTTNKGMAKLNTPYYTQSLPSTADGLIYIYLGQATDATHVELVLDHPIYEYYGSGIRLYREYYDSGEVDTLLSGKSDIGHTHTIDSSLSSTSTNPVQNKVINSALAGKSDTGHTHTKSQITDFPTIPDVSGKIDTAGTGLSKSGTTLNHSNSITALTTATLKKVKYDAQGHITGTADVIASDLPSHTHNYSTFSGSYNDLTNKPTIPDVSGKIDTAGTGLSKSGTTLNHSNSITAVTTAALKKIKYDAQGHITGVSDVSGSDLPSHTHSYATSNDISSSISTHNSSSSAHSTEMAKKLDISQTSYKGKNVVVDSTSGNISFEDKIVRDDINNHMLYGFNDKLIFEYDLSNALYYDKDGHGDDSNNEVATMGDLPSDVSDLTDTSNTAFTPKSHASSTTAYGAASTSNYGHTKLYDGVNSSSTDLAATANAVKIAYDRAEEKAAENHTHTASEIEFTAGTDFGEAASNITNTSAALNYVMQDCNLKANINDIPTATSQLTNDRGFLTSHQSLTPTRVYNCTSWNSTYIDTNASNQLMLYKLGDNLYFLRYFLTTKSLTYATTDYNINSDSIDSDYRPPGDRTFYISTSKEINAKIVIKTTGKVTISASSNNQIVTTAGTLTYWW